MDIQTNVVCQYTWYLVQLDASVAWTKAMSRSSGQHLKEDQGAAMKIKEDMQGILDIKQKKPG